MEKQRIVNNLEKLGRLFGESLSQYENSEKKGQSELHKRAIELIEIASHYNSWFTTESVKHAYSSWSEALQKENIEQWLANYNLGSAQTPKKVGVIMAGNIPMVGLHDALSVLISGHTLLAKLSSKDEKLMSLCLDALSEIDNEWANRIERVDQLKTAEVLIATGNDNSARYFEYYFRNKPKIIRKNRTALALLTKDVSKEQLEGLAKDIFTYFGLGCRNVTKVYIPQDFELDRIFESLFPYKELIQHNHYANNYDYNKAVYLMNKADLLENGFILLKEDEGIHSPLGVLFYERYQNIEDVESKFNEMRDDIQLIVSNLPQYKNMGDAQKPQLWDYADGIDTIEFLLGNS